MAITSIIRARLQAPKHPDGGYYSSRVTCGHRVTLCHPGYPDEGSALLVLPALDVYKKQGLDEDGSDGQIGFGLHHETARVACAIVANCRWDGFLSEDKAAGAMPVQIGPDDLLLGSNYYFHVPNSVGDTNPEPYPIVPSFAHFKFPHNNLPPTWKALSIPLKTTTNSVHARDVSCRVTLSTLGTEIAHLIPRRENSWFARNQMGRYSSQTLAATATLTGDARNAILLCSNIHSTFNQRRFVFVPKHGSWVIHVVSGIPRDELPAVYHNAQPQQLSGIAVEYLFARFAWTVLSSGIFIHAGVPRRLITLRQEDGVSGVSDVSGEECRTLFAPNFGSKSCNSPRKRVREDEEGADVLEEDDDDLDELDDSDDSVWDTRGRSRKRAFYG